MSENQLDDLLRLNDDCLREVLERLDVIDLTSVADVCWRLRDLAQLVFASKCKRFKMVGYSEQEIRNCLRNFGPFIHSLCLQPKFELINNYGNIVKSLVQNCSGTLTTLQIHNFTFEKTHAAVMMSQSLFSGVLKLVLIGCSISVKWFVMCPELVELVLINTHVTYHGLRHQLCHKLETLRIQGSLSWVKNGLHLFLQQNSQLKTLEILPFNQESSVIVLPYHSPLTTAPSSIENLTVRSWIGDELARFQSLKTLRIVSQYIAFCPFSRLTNATLEHLEIDAPYFFLSTGDIGVIPYLRRIKTLNLYIYWFENDRIVNMITNLDQLSELRVCTMLNNLSGSDLLSTVQHGENLERLILSFFINREVEIPFVNSLSAKGRVLQVNEKSYQKLLNAVLHRSNGKPLLIIILCGEGEMKEIDTNFTMNPSLKIVCLSIEKVERILHVDANELGNNILCKITDDDLKVLRSRGLCP